VHPRVVDTFLDGTLVERWAAGPSRPRYGLGVEERKLLAVLEDEPASDAGGDAGREALAS
jgi:hypothetical protein